MNVVIALLLVALGMGIDAMYQHKIRVAECDAYEIGYQQRKTEEHIRCTERAKHADGKQIAAVVLDEFGQKPSMAAPVEMPPTAVERLRTHGRATWRVER